MVGRFNWVKDQGTICKALSLLKQRGLPVRLTLVGRGDKKLENECKSICKELEIENLVHFLGLCNDVPEILNKTDIFVFSSLCDTFGIALLEAMAWQYQNVWRMVEGVLVREEPGQVGVEQSQS